MEATPVFIDRWMDKQNVVYTYNGLLSSVAHLCLTLWDLMDCSMPVFPVHHQLLKLDQKFMSVESVMPSHHLILCCPLLLLPSIFPSIRIFYAESVLRIKWPKYCSFSFSISPSNEYSGQISFRMDWLDLFAVQGTLKRLLQHHSSKASILWRSAFFIEPFNFSFFSVTGWGIDLDYCDIEWFALETNRDHAVIFEIASKYLLHFGLLLTMMATPFLLRNAHSSRYNGHLS